MEEEGFRGQWCGLVCIWRARDRMRPNHTSCTPEPTAGKRSHTQLWGVAEIVFEEVEEIRVHLNLLLRPAFKVGRHLL